MTTIQMMNYSTTIGPTNGTAMGAIMNTTMGVTMGSSMVTAMGTTNSANTSTAMGSAEATTEPFYNDLMPPHFEPEPKTVHVVAPSGIGKLSNVDAYRRFLQTLLMVAQVSDSVYKYGVDPFYANSDLFRSDDLADALTDGSDIVWCAKGGAGASRLIPFLEALPDKQRQQLTNARKIFIGSSDSTVIHVYLQMVYGWQTIYGAMLDAIVDHEVSEGSVEKLVELVDGTSTNLDYVVDLLTVPNTVVTMPIKSSIVGGSLTLVESTIGTTFALNGNGRIVFLEDSGVPPYAVERSLDHMRLAGVFNGAEAILFGRFNEVQRPKLMTEVFKRFANSISCPVFVTNRIGHGYVSDPLPLNTYANIEVTFPEENRTLYTLTVANVY